MIKNKLKTLTILALTCCNINSTICQAQQPSLFMRNNKPQHIFVKNRILAKVNGKPITAIDVMKKMDLHFYKQYPNYASSVEARYQFYQMGWKTLLNEMIEKELILTDAAQNKVEASHGDIRQEMESTFGPNIMMNLDRAGLTYEEAWDMIKQDLVIRKNLLGRVNSKAYKTVTPQLVRTEYEQYCKDNMKEDQWKYQVISIRSNDQNSAGESAKKIHDLILSQNISMDNLRPEIEKNSLISKNITLNISEEQINYPKEISESYREVLTHLEPGQYSTPKIQQSRAKGDTVYRIFYLKEVTPGGVSPIATVELKLRNKLLDKALERESNAYLSKIRDQYDVQDLKSLNIPDDFQPFILQ